jgi:5-methylcytosine-specific restriction endonuclease McrA
MQRVLVIDKNKQPLMPCTPARARELLRKGKAAVFRRYPFTIILKDREGGDVQNVTFKIDPGSKRTGLALVADFQRGKRVIWAAVLEHRGQQIKKALESRRSIRRSRRNRKTRYREARFDNRRRAEGWLPPSLQSRVDNIWTWWGRIYRFAPLHALSMELVKFDTQVMQNPEINGVEYQQGTLYGYEVREYLLEKWQRKCAYCEEKDTPLEIEHIIPKSRGGSDRVSNLTLACHDCNQKKGNQIAAEFGHPEVQKQARQPLKDTAAVNTTRWALFRRLESTGLPLEVGTGGRTKFNRTQQNYPKAHWIDAACVGESGAPVYVTPNHAPLLIKATGRQSRQMCRMDKYGFPRTKAKQARTHFGFQTGDIVKAIVPSGKYAGTHIGRVAVRRKGDFCVGKTDGIAHRFCRILHLSDGYAYTKGERAHGW